MRKGFKASKYSLIITLVFCTALLLVFTANAATEGEYKPLNYTGACLTTINDNTSTTGGSIVNRSNVPTNPTIKIIFDKNIASDSVWDINRQCFTLRNTAGSNVPIDVFRISDEINFNERRHVFITPLNNLSPGKTYKIIVSGNLTAKNGVKMGQDEEITFATAEAPDNAAPAWPAAGKLTASNVTQNSLSLSWNAATDNKAVTAYRVYRGSTLLGTATGTSFNASGLNAATQYTFKVEAGDAAGNWSTDGPSVTVTTAEAPDNTAPAWPAAGKLTASNVTQNSLSLSWNAATDNKAVTAYRVYRGSTLLGTATGTSFNASGLNAATQYTFKVEAGDAAGNWSTDGPSVTVTTAEAPDNTAPAWPAAGKLTASNVTQNSLSLSWNAATDNKAVTAYRVYRGSTLLGTATGTSFNASGLNAATQYTFKVEAGDAAGNWSTDGPSVTVTTAEASGDTAPPSWPLFSCIRVADITQTSLTLSWNAARDNVGVTGYRIYQNGVLLGVADSTTFNVTGLSPNTRYSFKVEAGDAAGNWSTDGPKAFMLTPAADTKPPVWSLFGKYLRITDITQTSLTLSWSAARDNAGVTGYRIYQDGVLLGVADSTTFNVTGLSPNTRYSFKVEAGDAAGNWSTDGPRAFVLTPAGKTSKTLAIYTETTGNGIFFSADNSGAFESPRVWPLYGYF